jgi:hypothetical protein
MLRERRQTTSPGQGDSLLGGSQYLAAGEPGSMTSIRYLILGG